MRRRRKAKYTWMPTLGGVTQSGDSGIGTTSFGIYMEANPNSAINSVFIRSLVPDQTTFPDQADAVGSLRDYTEGQDWFLKRIVGKIPLCVQSGAATGTTSWRFLQIAAAFFVARAKDDDNDTPDLDVDEYDPLGSQNVRQPWIWRRTWILQNPLVATSAAPPIVRNWAGFPAANTSYGSVADGAHIDAKTARRIRREERLWFVVSAFGFNNVFGNDGETVTTPEISAIGGLLDYRILGQMRKSSNRSTF